MSKKICITILLAAAVYSSNSLAFSGSDGGFSFGNQLVDAADQGNSNLVLAILNQGIDANETGKFETSALHRAAFKGNTEVASILLSSGANVNSRDYGGASPLHISARTGNVDVSRLLIGKGADINSQDDQGYTPLHRAVSNNQVPVSMLLIESGADVNTVNNEGNSPLIDAIRISSATLVKELIIKGAEKTIKNNKGLGAIDFALKAGNAKIDALLSGVDNSLVAQSSVEPGKITVTQSAPAFLKNEIVNTQQPQFADISVLANNNKVEYIQSVKVNTPPVQAEDIPDISAPHQYAQYSAPQAVVQPKVAVAPPTPAVMPNVQYASNESNLQRAPRLPDDGKLPSTKYVEFQKEIQNKAVEQIRLAQAQANANMEINPIELPKNIAEIENVSQTIQIQAPQQAPQQAQQQNSPVVVAQFIKDESAKNMEQQQKAANQLAANIVNTLGMIEPSAGGVIPASMQAQPTTPQNTTNINNEVSTEEKVTKPVKDIQVISPVKAAPVSRVQNIAPNNPPAIDWDYAKEVDSMMDSYVASTPAHTPTSAPIIAPVATPIASPVSIPAPILQDLPVPAPASMNSASYEMQVDGIMDKLISQEPDVNEVYLIDPVIAPVPNDFESVMAPSAGADQPVLAPQSYPASLAMKQFMTKNPAMENRMNNYVQTNIVPASYTSQPIYYSNNPVPKGTAARNYDFYKASLVDNINEFYNKNSDKASYDISDLEKERISNLGISTHLDEKEIMPEPSKILDAGILANEQASQIEQVQAETMDKLQSKDLGIEINAVKNLNISSSREDNDLKSHHAIIEAFTKVEDAVNFFNENSTKTGLVYNYKIIKSPGSDKFALAIGKLKSESEANDICLNFKADDKLCRTKIDADEANYQIVTVKKVYALIGEFKTKGETESYFAQKSKEFSDELEYQIMKDDNSDAYILQIGPVVNGLEAKDICDNLAESNKICKVLVD